MQGYEKMPLKFIQVCSVVEGVNLAFWLCRFEAMRPLGSVEFIPVPFVTETTNVLLAVLLTESNQKDFLPLLSTWISMVSSASSKLRLIYGLTASGNKSAQTNIAERCLNLSREYVNLLVNYTCALRPRISMMHCI